MLKWTSVPGKILEFAFSGAIIPVFNDEIVEEYRQVLMRDKFHLTRDIVDDIIFHFLFFRYSSISCCIVV